MKFLKLHGFHECLLCETIYQNFEEKLKMIMGTKVNINHGKKGKGKIEIEYYSPDEFERIMELMTKIADKN